MAVRLQGDSAQGGLEWSSYKHLRAWAAAYVETQEAWLDVLP